MCVYRERHTHPCKCLSDSVFYLADLVFYLSKTSFEIYQLSTCLLITLREKFCVEKC